MGRVHFDVLPKLVAGIQGFTQVLELTYGPRGRTVFLERPSGSLFTKDGTTIGWELVPEDILERLGVFIVREACHRVSKKYGDGATTTALLISALLKETTKWTSLYSPSELASEIRNAWKSIEWSRLESVEANSQTIHDLLCGIGNGDRELAQAVVEASEMVGDVGMVVVEEGTGRGVELEMKPGLEFDRGWESSEFATEGQQRELMTPLLALINGTISSVEAMAPIVEAATQFPFPLVVVSRGVFGKALQLLLANDRKLKKPDGSFLEVVAVRIPGAHQKIWEFFGDLRAATGATVLEPKLEKFESGFFGSAQKVIVQERSTTFFAYPDRFEDIERRVVEISDERGLSAHEVEEARTRRARLTEGLCVLRVGAPTRAGIRFRRGLAERMLGVFQHASGGLVVGGGKSYQLLGRELRGVGGKILGKALEMPLLALDPDGMAGGDWIGWDVNDRRWRDFRDFPTIFSPKSQIFAVVETAVSVVTTLLGTTVAVTK